MQKNKNSTLQSQFNKTLKRQNSKQNSNDKKNFQFGSSQQKPCFRSKDLFHSTLTQKQKYSINYNDDFLSSFFPDNIPHIVRQGKHENYDSRKKVQVIENYPYNCFGKVEAIYKKEKLTNQQLKVKNHKKVKNEQQQHSYTYGIAAFVGQKIMATAAHVAPASLDGKKLMKIRVYFPSSQLVLQVDKVIIHPQYQYEKSNSVSPFDMALFVMKPHNNFQFPKKYLSIEWDYSPEKYPDYELKFLTFQDQKKNSFILKQAILSSQKIEKRNQYMILYKNTTNKGDSGSLILLWKRKQNQYKVIGIHIGDYGKGNYGLLLTSKAYSPKDIFSQMIQHDFSIQQIQKSNNNQSQGKKTFEQNQVVKQLLKHGNYQASTQKQIKQLKLKNDSLLVQITLYKNMYLEEKDKKKGSKNESQKLNRKVSKQSSTPSPTKIQRMQSNICLNKLNQRYTSQLNFEYANKIKGNMKETQKQLKNGKKGFFCCNAQYKNQPISLQPNTSKDKQQQENCFMKICRVISDMFYVRRAATISNSNQTSCTIIPN